MIKPRFVGRAYIVCVELGMSAQVRLWAQSAHRHFAECPRRSNNGHSPIEGYGMSGGHVHRISSRVPISQRAPFFPPPFRGLCHPWAQS
jgi:hypothetical protein